MKTTVKNAAKIAQQINAQYNKLNTDNENFFNAYHDDLRLQRDCAWEDLAELEEGLKNPRKVYGQGVTGQGVADDVMKNLQDTLTYCKAVIDLQTQTNNLPKSIYG